MANQLPPIPNDKIGETHQWREWFYNLGRYIQIAQNGGVPWRVDQGGTGVPTATGYLYGNGTNPVTSSTSIPTAALSGALVDSSVTALHKHDFDNVTFPTQWSLGTFTHVYTLQELMNHEWSAGIVDGCALTDNGNGTVSIAAGVAVIRGQADGHTTLYGVITVAQNNIALTDNATNYIYLDYNAGSPQFAVSTAITSFNCMDKCIAWMVHRSGNVLHYTDAREQNVDSNRKLRQFLLKQRRFSHDESGSVLGAIGLSLTLTAGAFNFMLQALPHDAFDTSIAGTANANVFTLWSVASGVWTETPYTKVVSTTTYNDTTTGVVTLGNNKFGVSWVYVVNNTPSELHVIMGQAEYANIAEARVATPPVTIPTIISGMGSLVGFVVYEKSNTVFDNIYSAFSTAFTPGLATTHNGLSGIQTMSALPDDNYHFAYSQAVDLTDGGDSNLHYHATDRDSANFTGTNWTDLTDAGDSILHYHASDRALANTTGAGTGVLTALAVNVGTAGAVVVNGGALGTPTSGTLDACTTNTEVAGTNNTQLANTAHVFAERTNTATLTNKTLTGGLVTATLADNTATLNIADAKFVKSQIAADANNHGHAQAVEMTYAASGSTGIVVADSTNTRLATNDFTIIWDGSLQDWTPSAAVAVFVQRLDGSNIIWFYVDTDGKLGIYAYIAGAYVIPTSKSTVATGLVDGTTHQIKVAVIRETATTAGSVTFYVDGVQLGTSVSITAAATASISLSGSLTYISGTQAGRFASTTKTVYVANRAITAAEALSIYRNGLAYADKWGSQTNNVTGTNADFSGAGNWLPNTDITLTTAYDSGDAGHATCLRIQGSGAGLANWKGAYLVAAYQGFVADKRQRVKFNYKWVINNSGGGQVYFGASGPQSNTFPVTSGWANYNGVATVTGVETVSVTSGGTSAFELLIDDFEVYDAGATLALESEGIQPNQWHDSANNLHATYPTAGASLTRWKETGLYEWTTAITADTTLTSIVPAGYELEKISFKNSTTNAVSVRLGTTAGGTDIFGLTALNISTTLGGYKTVLCNQGFSTTTAQTLYLSSTAWSSASLTFTMYFRRIS